MFAEHELKKPDFESSDLETILDYYVFHRELIDFNQKQHESREPSFLAQKFLAEHWQHIRKTPIVYPKTPLAPSTQFCLNLAEQLFQMYPKDEKDADTNSYSFLMPTVRNTEEFKKRKLGEIILTDDAEYGLVVEECIYGFDRNKIYYFNKKKDKSTELSRLEMNRLKHHSPEAEAYFDAVKLCSSNASIGKALKMLVNGLMWSIQCDSLDGTRDNLSQQLKAASIDTFKNFLDELEIADPVTHKELMKKEGNWGSLASIWDRLLKLPDSANEIYLRAGCVRALLNIKKSARNQKFFEKENPKLFVHVSVQAHAKHEAYLAAAEADTLKTAVPGYQKLKRQQFLLGLLNHDERKEIFARSRMDKELAVIWKSLSAAEKNQLAEVLDHERLLMILKQQRNPQMELQQAIESLGAEIKLNGGFAAHPEAVCVLKHIYHSEKEAEPVHFPLLAELAHRTAVGIRNPKNEANVERYPIVATKLSEWTFSQKVSASAKGFFGVMILGSFIISCVLTAGVPLIIPALIGVFGLGVTCHEAPHWKRSTHHHTSVAAMSFLNKKMHSASNNIQPVLPKNHLSYSVSRY